MIYDFNDHSDYASLLARHNALLDTANRNAKEGDRCRQELKALREAVAWERECQAFTYRNPLSIDAMKEILRTRYAARAEVDRLLEDK